MKLTKKLLAVVLTVAMVLGMVAVGATASITDYYEYDKDTNPYTAKIALKAYKVNTDDGTYTEITDGAVNPGDVVRVEIWQQNNYFTVVSSYAIMYSNKLFQPTALDYSIYDYFARPTATGVTKVFDMVAMDEDHAYSAEGTISNPFYLNECVVLSPGGFVGLTSTMTNNGQFANVKKLMPYSWQGSGNKQNNYYSNEAALDYNYYLAATLQDADYVKPGAGMAIILTELQPVMYFNLTIPADAVAGTSGKIAIDPETVASSTVKTGQTFIARNYTSDGSGEADAMAGELQYISSTSTQKYQDAYGEDTTKYDRYIDVTEASITLTVGGGSVEPPAPTVDKDELKAAIDTLPEITQANATSASWKAYTDALAAANAVYADDAADQTAVDNAKTVLLAAIAGVQALGDCSYTALDAAIAEYDGLTLSDYTPNSVAASNVEALYAAAKAVERNMKADEAGENQAKIDAAATALANAIDALVEKADKAALNAAIATDVSTANCPAAAVTAYNNALAAAQNVAADDNATQAAVDNAKEALLEAIAGLVPLGNCNYAVLDAAIAEYDGLTLSDYTPASVAASNVEALYAAAKAVERDMVADEAGANQAKIDAAATALNDAIDALVEKADKAALKAAIDTVVDLNNRTSASLAAYNTAKADADAAYADENASQDAVNAAAAALTAAIDGLKYLDKCDYAALNAAIGAYDALTLSDYTPNSVAASNVEALYAAAKAVEADMYADEAGVNQAEINAAATALDAAVKALVKKANKDALNAAINTDVDTTDCTAASVEAYNNALAAAQALAADDNASQDAVDAAAAALNAAITGLKGLGTCDYAALDAAIDAYDALVKDDYTPASWDASGVDAAYAAAKAVARDLVADEAGANQAGINAAATALNDAIDALVEKADKAALVAALAVANGYTADAYTPASWTEANLAEVIAAAEVVNADANATAEDVAAAVEALEAAAAKLVVKADKAALAAAIDTAEALKEADYTPESWAAADLANVIALAKIVLNDDNAADTAVAAEIANLEAAAAKLVALANKDNLKVAIDTLPAVSMNNATEASWAAYAKALGEANEVYANANATQTVVDAAEATLLAAIAAVEAKACNYAALDAAIERYDALVLADYVDVAAATAAYEAAKAIARDLTMDEAGANQATIAAAAAALNEAIDALQKKADKAALKAAIDAVPAYTEETATEATWADYVAALAAANEVYANAAATQEDVDAAANELSVATAALAARELCDYSALAAALALTPAEDQNKYTTASWKAYADAKAAAQAIAKNLINDKSGVNQAAITAAAQALVDAFNALEISKAAVTKVDVDLSEYTAKATMPYTFTVTGAPSKLQVVGQSGSTLTFDRYHRNVTVVSYNAAGEVVDYKNEAPAYEVWTVPMTLGEGTFSVKAKFGSKWEAFSNEFVVEFVDYAEDEVKFVAKDSASDAQAGKALVIARGGVAEITVVAPESAYKVQLVFASGSTSTYSASNATVVNNGDGTCTWTISRAFKSAGTGSMTLKLRDTYGWYEANTGAISTEVTK